MQACDSLVTLTSHYISVSQLMAALPRRGLQSGVISPCVGSSGC